MNRRGIRMLIVLAVLVSLGLCAYLVVSTVDVVTLLKRIHGG